LLSATNQQINKSTNQQINKSTNQQINKSTNQQINKSTNQQINKSTNHRINESTQDNGWRGRNRRYVPGSSSWPGVSEFGDQHVAALYSSENRRSWRSASRAVIRSKVTVLQAKATPRMTTTFIDVEPAIVRLY
jgi:hypothetical protein